MKNLLVVFLAAFSIKSYNQQMGPNISFNKETHDFGFIQESKGKVSCKFEFINTGNEPLIINTVKASCGCTASEWTKAPVAPGSKGFISATYDPTGRPGTFSKTIHVSSNSIDNPHKVLTIKGIVQPKPESLNDLYPRDMGEVRLKSNHMNFGKVFKDTAVTKQMGIINVSKIPVKISFNNVPTYITIRCIPETLKPSEKGNIEIVYDGSKNNDWEFVLDRINVVINGNTDNNKQFTVSADLSEDFSKLSAEQLANAPKIVFGEESYDFGTIKQNVTVEHTFVFRNEGKSDLYIRKIKSTCGCTVVTPEKNVIAPGESSNLITKFSSGTRSGNQTKPITIVTNDPTKPVTRIYVKSFVSGPVGKEPTD